MDFVNTEMNIDKNEIDCDKSEIEFENENEEC